MKSKFKLKPIPAVLGVTFAVTMAAAPLANAENPFSFNEMGGGYMVAETSEGKCGTESVKKEGMCGAKKMMTKMDADQDGSISREEFDQHHEKMFSKMDADKDGKLSQDEIGAMKHGKAGGEGKCGEGKCGEGKCAGRMLKDKGKSTVNEATDSTY